VSEGYVRYGWAAPYRRVRTVEGPNPFPGHVFRVSEYGRDDLRLMAHTPDWTETLA
jgi:hypothetical protein